MDKPEKEVEHETHPAVKAGAGHDWMTRIVETFLQGNLSVLLIVMSLIAGAASLLIRRRQDINLTCLC